MQNTQCSSLSRVIIIIMIIIIIIIIINNGHIGANVVANRFNSFRLYSNNYRPADYSVLSVTGVLTVRSRPCRYFYFPCTCPRICWFTGACYVVIPVIDNVIGNYQLALLVRLCLSAFFFSYSVVYLFIYFIRLVDAIENRLDVKVPDEGARRSMIVDL